MAEDCCICGRFPGQVCSICLEMAATAPPEEYLVAVNRGEHWISKLVTLLARATGQLAIKRARIVELEREKAELLRENMLLAEKLERLESEPMAIAGAA